MKLLEAVSGALALHAFLDLLSDAVVVLDRSGRLSFANAAALRLLRCEAGWPLERLQPSLGGAVLRWVRNEIAGTGQLGQAAPQAVLLDGRKANVALQRLGARRWALRLSRGTAPLGEALVTRITNLPPSGSARRPQATSEELPRLLWSSPFPVVVTNAEFQLVDVNQAFIDFCGFDLERLTGTDLAELQPEVDRAELRVVRRHCQENFAQHGVPAVLECRYLDANGHMRWTRESWHALADAQGAYTYFAVMQDTTAEHIARERADSVVRELDDWFDLSPLGMVLFENTGLLVRANRAFTEMVGTMPALLSEATLGIQALLAFNNGNTFTPIFPDAAPLERHAWMAGDGGSARRLRATIRNYATPDGKLRYMAIVEDRSIEEERDLARMQIGALMDAAGVGLATFQESSGWVRQRVGEAASTDSAPAPSAGLQNISRSIVLPQSLAEFEKVQHALKHALRVEGRYAIQHATMGLRWLLTRVEPSTLASGQRSTSVVTLDITDQHQSQQRNEQLLREMTTILASSHAGIAYIRGNELVRCNQRFENMLGLSPGSAAGGNIVELFTLQPQAQRSAHETMQALAQGQVYETEFEVASLNGPLWYSLSAQRSGPASDSIEAIVVLSDITRLKSQQNELEILARDRELMFSLSEVGIAYLRHGRIQRANEALSALTGYPVAELQNLALDILFVDRVDFDRLWAREDEALRRSGRWSGERQLRCRGGQLLWVQVSKRLVIAGDPGGGIIASYVNVDARRHAEQAVALQAERTRAILDSVLVGIVTVGANGIEWMNRSARRMFAGDLDDFIKRPISTVATDEAEHPFRQTQYLDVLVEGQAETFECRVKARDGREFWVVGNAVVTGRGRAGRQLTYALLDIERRREAEARIAEARASLQRLIELAPLAIALLDASSLRVLQLNQMAADVFGFIAGELVGSSLANTHPPELAATIQGDIDVALTTAMVSKREYAIAVAGEQRMWDTRYLPVGTHDQQTDQLLLVATDVTEQHAAQEARLDAAIEQREMLVKEVHHRIKNNLQGVAGLLQQIAARKPEVGPTISEVVGQVQAIAQVYGLQVGTAGLLKVCNVLEAITGSVQRTFGCTIALTLEGVDVQQWVLPEAESIPIALTINELLTNAVKHCSGADVAGNKDMLSCRMVCADTGVSIVVGNAGQLIDGFNLSRFPGGVSGLGLVRALLPRRSASLVIEQHGPRVLATVTLTPPGVSRLAPPDYTSLL